MEILLKTSLFLKNKLFAKDGLCEHFYPAIVLNTCLSGCHLYKTKVYFTTTIPQQWQIGKVFPVFKTNGKSKIYSYRSILNICSTSKVILQRLIEIQEQNSVIPLDWALLEGRKTLERRSNSPKIGLTLIQTLFTVVE